MQMLQCQARTKHWLDFNCPKRASNVKMSEKGWHSKSLVLRYFQSSSHLVDRAHTRASLCNTAPKSVQM